jgi:hypothetical protein
MRPIAQEELDNTVGGTLECFGYTYRIAGHSVCVGISWEH